MKYSISFLISVVIFFSCKKEGDTVAPTEPPITVVDSMFQILTIEKKDVNEFDITYIVRPPTNQNFENMYLCWSASAGFTTDSDSVLVSTISQPVVYHLSRLKQMTKYFGRIGLTFKGKRYYSAIKDWTTDTLKMTGAGDSGIERGFNRGDTTFAWTNLQIGFPWPDTKILIGTYECPIISDQGIAIQFSVPVSIPVGKYVFKIKTRGMEVQASDSVEILRGDWSFITSPPIPTGVSSAGGNGLISFGTCYSGQKGYIVGGFYLNGPPVPFPNNMYPEYILEFDGSSQTWIKRNTTNQLNIESPICYYYNNNVYIIAGKKWVLDPITLTSIYLKKILKLDLNTLTWTELGDVPYPTIFNLTSFELNNEWYIGGGVDSANRSLCCGLPLPSKKFWKYNPAINQWTQLADFPGGYQPNPTSFSIGSKGYSFYGAIPVGDPNVSTQYTQQFWEYNAVTSSWSSISLPSLGCPPAGEKYGVISYNSKAYFLTSQVRVVGSGGYDYNGSGVYTEWDPTSPGIYKNVAFPQRGDIFKLFYISGNKFYFQSDAFGYYLSAPNRTYSFLVEQ